MSKIESDLPAADVRRKARQRWKKAKNGILAQQAFSEAGRRFSAGGTRSRQIIVKERKDATMSSPRERRYNRVQTSPRDRKSNRGAKITPRKSQPLAATSKNSAREAEIVQRGQAVIREGVRGIRRRGEAYGLVTNHIIIGSRELASDSKAMLGLGVTHILNICSQLPNYFPQKFVYLKINVLDSPDVNLLEHFESIVAFLSHVEEVNGRALVHCVAGSSRSATAVIMHLMNGHTLHLADAFKKLRSARPQTNPNTGFKYQLAELEIELYGGTSVGTIRDWDFYAWNKVKNTYPKLRGSRQMNRHTSSTCSVS